MAVTVLALVSHLWDTSGSVSVMVAPYVANPRRTAKKSAVTALRTALQVVDHDIAGGLRAEQPHRLSAPLTSIVSAEADGAAQGLGLATDEILLAALGRTIARTIGAGVITVDVARDGRAVLQPVELTCATEDQLSASDAVWGVHRTLAITPHRRIGHGVLQYFGGRQPVSDIFFNYVGAVTEPPAQAPVSGHALELRVTRRAGLVHLDWWYDARRFDRATIQEFTEQFPFALIELTSEATPPV